MSEFDFIRDLKPLADPVHALNLEDDAATLPASDVICTDTLVEGVHFFGNEDPASLAHKVLAVNVSDLAAMNARATHALLNISLTMRCDTAWRASFIDGLKRACDGFGLQILGGDTTGSGGPIVLSATLLGSLEGRQVWKRADAQVGDLVCVSGTVGQGGLGLRDWGAGQHTEFAAHYRKPQPQTGLLGLTGVGGCADVSDGLIADLAHICRASNVTAVVDLDQVPLADADEDWVMQLTGGDDYQLVFTLSAKATPPQGCTVIGWVKEASREGPVILRGPDAIVAATKAKGGYSHF